MLYLNQYDYPHIPYEHYTEYGGAPEDRRNVAAAGCGLCCLCMIVNHLTGETLEITECVRLSETSGANGGRGTRIHVLGPIIAEMYHLEYRTTNDIQELLQHLHSGGEAIANVGGDYDGHIGIFSHKGHFIVITSAKENTVCVLDPSFKEGKYEEEGRSDKVFIQMPFLYCSSLNLAADVLTRDPSFYLFKRIDKTTIV